MASFHDLPAEIRLQIYHYLVPNGLYLRRTESRADVYPARGAESTTGDASKIDAKVIDKYSLPAELDFRWKKFRSYYGWLFTCQKVYNEAGPLVYRNVVLCLNGITSSYIRENAETLPALWRIFIKQAKIGTLWFNNLLGMETEPFVQQQDVKSPFFYPDQWDLLPLTGSRLGDTLISSLQVLLRLLPGLTRIYLEIGICGFWESRGAGDQTVNHAVETLKTLVDWARAPRSSDSHSSGTYPRQFRVAFGLIDINWSTEDEFGSEIWDKIKEKVIATQEGGSIDEPRRFGALDIHVPCIVSHVVSGTGCQADRSQCIYPRCVVKRHWPPWEDKHREFCEWGRTRA